MGKAEFDQALQRVRTLPSTPAADVLLELYGLYKQAVEGDVTGSRPGIVHFKERAKWDAWASRKGLQAEVAMEAYIRLVDELVRASGR